MIIFGAGGLGKLVLEILQSNEIVIYGFLDDDSALHDKTIDEIPVLGSTDEQGFLKLIGKKCQAFVAQDDVKLKQGLVAMLNEKRKVMPINAIHREAYLSGTSELGHGNLISAGVVVNANTSLGHHNIMHANSTLDYDCRVGDFVEIGAGSTVGNGVTLKNGSFVGVGATIVAGVTIGENARIGAGSVVISDIEDNETVFGVPAEAVNQ